MNKPSRRQLAEIIVNLLGSGMSEANLARQIAAYLLSERRTAEIEPLMRDALNVRAQKTGTAEITAASAHRISKEAKQQLKRLVIRQYPSVKRMLLSEEHDPQAVGGVRLTSGEMQLDLTVHGRLQRLSRLTTENA